MDFQVSTITQASAKGLRCLSTCRLLLIRCLWLGILSCSMPVDRHGDSSRFGHKQKLIRGIDEWLTFFPDWDSLLDHYWEYGPTKETSYNTPGQTPQLEDPSWLGVVTMYFRGIQIEHEPLWLAMTVLRVTKGLSDPPVIWTCRSPLELERLVSFCLVAQPFYWAFPIRHCCFGKFSPFWRLFLSHHHLLTVSTQIPLLSAIPPSKSSLYLKSIGYPRKISLIAVF